MPIEAIEERFGGAKRPKLSSARLSRCGSCAGCTRGDCGECKNCLDKPKFGGRGIKKQACLRRTCVAAEAELEEEEQTTDSAAVAAAAALAGAFEGGFLSQEASPALKPTEGPADALADGALLLMPLAESQLRHQVQDKAGSAYSTADEEEASEDAAQALVLSSLPKGVSATSLLACAAHICRKREASQVDEPFSMVLGAAATLPKMAVV